MPRKYPSLKDRLLANSRETPHPDQRVPCRLWTGGLNSSGYGKINIRHRYRDKRTGHRRLKTLLVHRVALALHMGLQPWQLNHVLHYCDRRNCIEPAHLRSTTQKKNMEDMVKKGRHRNGASKRST